MKKATAQGLSITKLTEIKRTTSRIKMPNNLSSLLEIIELRTKDLLNEIEELKAANRMLRTGLEGACYACEPVGELNQKLADAGHALYHALAYHSDNFAFMNRQHGFSQEKNAVKNWRELFNSTIPDQDIAYKIPLSAKKTL